MQPFTERSLAAPLFAPSAAAPDLWAVAAAALCRQPSHGSHAGLNSWETCDTAAAGAPLERPRHVNPSRPHSVGIVLTM
ncbi:MAG: hypothetical protein WDW36_006370 [Sanguina aurantia]